MIKNRILKNFKKRKSWPKQRKIEAYRLYERDIPEYPYIVDIYPGYCFVWEKGSGKASEEVIEKHREEILTSLSEIFPNSEVILKERKRQKGNEQYVKVAKKNEFFEFQELQAKFYGNAYDYLDTGIFLDHREVRQKIYRHEGKSFLNLFSYTSSASVFAALSGKRTVSVDMSNTYLDWSKKNFDLNNIDRGDHKFVRANCVEYLKGLSSKEKFDLILLDPPSFSNSKKMDEHFDVQTDHVELVEHCMRVLAPNGLLIFSNNFRKFKIDEGLQEKFHIEDISEPSIPEDFRDKKIHHCFLIKEK